MRHEYYLNHDWAFCSGAEGLTGPKNKEDAFSYAKAGGLSGPASPAFDDTEWRRLDVPHDFLNEEPFAPDNLIVRNYKEAKNAWYRKTFRLPEEDEGKHILLSFEGIAMASAVYFNGSLIAASDSGYVPVVADITDRAYFGNRLNTLAVFVDGTITTGWWYEGAGIYRDVKITVKEPLHIERDGIWVKAVPGEKEKWDTVCQYSVKNSAYSKTEFSVRTDIYDGETLIASDLSETVSCSSDDMVTLTRTIPVSEPKLWDIDSPNLYRVRVTLLNGKEELDSAEVRTGYRTFSADPEKGFILNGRKIKIFGTCNHLDHAGVGIAVPDSIHRYRIRLLKEMGTNAYRCSHNMPTEAVLDACDELGLLVIDENRKFETSHSVLEHVEALIRRDRNHPSIFAWSLLNEEPLQGKPEGKRIYRRLRSFASKLDDTRLFTGAMDNWYDETIGASPEMDIVGINYAIPYGPEAFRKQFPEKPVYGTETHCTLSVRGCYRTNSAECMFSNYDEDHAAWGSTARAAIDFALKNDWYFGIFLWSGFDYRGEPTPSSWPATVAYFGVFDLCGFPKDAYWQNRAAFVKEPVLHLFPHWNWNAKKKEEVRVMTASNCEEVELFLNGESLGRKASSPVSPAEWKVPFVPGTIRAVGYINGNEVISEERKTAGSATRIVLTPDRTEICGNGLDAVPFTVSLEDENGNPVEKDDRKIHLKLEGDAVLLGVGNGDPTSHESDRLPQRKLFAGKMQAIIGSKAGGREFTLTAYDDWGLVPASVTVKLTDNNPVLFL